MFGVGGDEMRKAMWSYKSQFKTGDVVFYIPCRGRTRSW